MFLIQKYKPSEVQSKLFENSNLLTMITVRSIPTPKLTIFLVSG